VTDIAIDRTRRGHQGQIADPAFRGATTFFAALVLIILGGVIVSLVDGAALALGTFGWGFLATDAWNPVTEKFGALATVQPDRAHRAPQSRHAPSRRPPRTCRASPTSPWISSPIASPASDA
jgi:hypothetical protein